MYFDIVSETFVCMFSKISKMAKVKNVIFLRPSRVGRSPWKKSNILTSSINFTMWGGELLKINVWKKAEFQGFKNASIVLVNN